MQISFLVPLQSTPTFTTKSSSLFAAVALQCLKLPIDLELSLSMALSMTMTNSATAFYLENAISPEAWSIRSMTESPTSFVAIHRL
ncbi:hypothetical protein ACTXT7_002510 [Hymenolepis weldensis]